MPYPSPADEPGDGAGCLVLALGVIVGAALASAVASWLLVL